MTGKSTQRIWAFVRKQHGVVTRDQLRAAGLTRHAIAHRLEKGRLHRIWPNVFAVGRPDIEREGILMAATLTCGIGAVVSHESAADLWGIRPGRAGPVHVSVPSPRDPRRSGIRVHRRREMGETRERYGIPITTPSQTIIDVAPGLTERQLERAIDEADKLDLVHPDVLHRDAARGRGRGAAIVRELLRRRTFVLTDSDLERRFIPIARRAGLPVPETRTQVNGYRVDFYFRERRLVVETDGGRYHRTPGQQRRDRIREHAHVAAGLTTIRFTHDQIAHEPDYVAGVLRRL